MDQIQQPPQEAAATKTEPQAPWYVTHRKTFWIVIIVVIVLIVGAGVMALLNKSKQGNGTSEKVSSFFPAPTPTPMPFVEMTIPHLRERSYTSSLGTRTQVAETATYTSYLTSYDSDGIKINGLLTIPKGDSPSRHPAIIFVHGYIPPTQYNTLTQYSAYVDYLARNGFVVFKIDLRGHGDSEGEAGGSYYSSDYIIDVLNAYAALESSDFVIPTGIGLWGHSMAGNVTFRALVAKQTIPAVNIWAGAVYTYEDMQKYGIDDNSYRPPPSNTERQKKRELLRTTHGDFDAVHPFWQQVVATNYLDGVTGAIQINHAVDDAVVNIGYSRDLMTLLDQTSIAHELKEHGSGGHNISGSAFTQAMQNTVVFFRTYLK